MDQGAHAAVRQKDGGGGGIGLAGFEVLIDGEQVYENFNFKFTAGVVHTIELVATADIFRGFLLRLESMDGQDTTSALVSSDNNAEVPFMCTEWEQVGGLGHNSNSAKTSINGTIYVANPTSALTLGVTVVVSTIYSYGTGEFYYSSFLLQAVAQGTSIIRETPPYNLATPAPSPQCKADGVLCEYDGACCSGRCIREDTQAIYANGYCLVSGSGTYQAPGQDYIIGTPIPTLSPTVGSSSVVVTNPAPTLKPTFPVTPAPSTPAPTLAPTLTPIPEFTVLVATTPSPTLLVATTPSPTSMPVPTSPTPAPTLPSPGTPSPSSMSVGVTSQTKESPTWSPDTYAPVTVVMANSAVKGTVLTSLAMQNGGWTLLTTLLSILTILLV